MIYIRGNLDIMSKRKHYYYFELKKGHAYLLYDEESLINLDSPLSIGNESEVKKAVTQLPKDAIITYSELLDVKIESSIKEKNYYHFELLKEHAYLLYDGKGLINLDSPLSIGNKRTVQSAIKGKLPIVTYFELTDVKITSSTIVFDFNDIKNESVTIVFDFKRGTTIDFEERNKKKTE